MQYCKKLTNSGRSACQNIPQPKYILQSLVLKYFFCNIVYLKLKKTSNKKASWWIDSHTFQSDLSEIFEMKSSSEK